MPKTQGTPFQKLLKKVGDPSVAIILDGTLDVVAYASALWDAMRDGTDVTREFEELGQSIVRFERTTGLKVLKERP